MWHIFLFLVLALLAAAAFFQVEAFLSVLYLVVLVYVLSRLWARQSMRALVFGRRIPQRLFWGEHITGEVWLENKSRLPIAWLDVHESLPVALASGESPHEVVSLLGHERHTITYRLVCRKRGVYTIGPSTVRLGDLFGLVPARVVGGDVDELVVYPRVVPLTQLGLPAHAPFVGMKNRVPLLHDPSRFVGVRPYAEGDPPRQIHWPASAHLDELMVKTFEPTIARETLLVLDVDLARYAHGQRYTAIELAVTATASMAVHLVQKEQQAVGLLAHGIDGLRQSRELFWLPVQSGHGHLVHMLEYLARIQPAEDVSVLPHVRRAIARLSWGATIVLATGDADMDVLSHVATWQRQGFHVVLVMVRPGLSVREARRTTDILGVPLYVVWDEHMFALGGVHKP
nr:DUF58 domain-containing protein [Ardenticatena sp.]